MHVLRSSLLPADKAALAYIETLDAEKDLCILAQHGLGIRPECARVLRVLTTLLKKAAAQGLTPFHIGSIMSRCGMRSYQQLVRFPELLPSDVPTR